MTFRNIRSDYSSNGNLPKYWFIQNDIRYLAKAGKKPYYQQITNEIIASKILQKAELPHVTYEAQKIEKNIYSICPTFITPDTEYIPAYEILQGLPF